MRIGADKSARRAHRGEPMDVQLTLRFRFGDEPDDTVTMLDNRNIPMVGSVFDSRDAILRQFARLLLKASLSQPKVLRELIPAVKLLRRAS